MKLEDLKRICDEAKNKDSWSFYLMHYFSPSRVKKMIEMLDIAEILIHEDEPEKCHSKCNTENCVRANWLSEFKKEFGNETKGS